MGMGLSDMTPTHDSAEIRLARTSIALATIAVALGIFCWWGLFSAAGQRRFDEMDGMYPFFAGVGAVVLALGALMLFLTILWRRHRRP